MLPYLAYMHVKCGYTTVKNVSVKWLSLVISCSPCVCQLNPLVCVCVSPPPAAAAKFRRDSLFCPDELDSLFSYFDNGAGPRSKSPSAAQIWPTCGWETAPVSCTALETVPVSCTALETVPVSCTALETVPVSLETVPVSCTALETVPVSCTALETVPVSCTALETVPVSCTALETVPVSLETVPVSCTALRDGLLYCPSFIPQHTRQPNMWPRDNNPLHSFSVPQWTAANAPGQINYSNAGNWAASKSDSHIWSL